MCWPTGGLVWAEAAHCVADGDALVEGREDAELHFPFESWLSDQDTRRGLAESISALRQHPDQV